MRNYLNVLRGTRFYWNSKSLILWVPFSDQRMLFIFFFPDRDVYGNGFLWFWCEKYSMIAGDGNYRRSNSFYVACNGLDEYQRYFVGSFLFWETELLSIGQKLKIKQSPLTAFALKLISMKFLPLALTLEPTMVQLFE